MFDITSWIREKIFRRPKLISNAPGEELTEKQTTKLGYFLLICMFLAILSTAQWTLSIIQGIPTRPEVVPSCVTQMISALDPEYQDTTYYNNYGGSYPYYDEYGVYNDCNIDPAYPKYDLASIYTILKPVYDQIALYRNEISNLESTKNNAQYKQNSSQQDYNTALTEKIARENRGIYDSQTLQNDIQNTRSEINATDNRIIELKQSISTLQSQHSAEVVTLKDKKSEADSLYKSAYLQYTLIIAILSFIFGLLVFSILYRLYVRQKLQNSPHTIIFSVATFAYGLILFQIAALFLWDIIPHKLLELLLGWISIFTPLLFLVQFLWPVLIIAIFGFLVYRIQKRLYSPENILKRFVTDKKCPNCGNSVDMTKPFCPLCSHEIHVHCPLCHELTLKGMPYCSNCGGKTGDTHSLEKSVSHILQDDLQSELAALSTETYSGVRFTLQDDTSFISKRETIVKLALYMTAKIGKTTFLSGEFAPFLDKILEKVDKKGISDVELNRVLGKIRTWIDVGGSVEFLKK